MERHLLLAEDDADLGHVFKAKLEHAGFHVTWKQDGEQAWDAILAERPVLVILDGDLPNVDGLELLRRIKGARLSVLFHAADEGDPVEIASGGNKARRERVIDSVFA